MSYITQDDYDRYMGEPIPKDDFLRYAARACEAVDAAAGWRIQSRGLARFGERDQAQIVLACCAQAEYFYLSGLDASLDGDSGGAYAIGKTQVSASSGSGGARCLCRKALVALSPTGLLYRGVAVW